MSPQDVTFVIPVFNGAATIGEAVQSALACVPAAREVIVVDDGSTDASAAVAEAAGGRVIRQANGGPAAARNTGIRAADTRWIALLDADDLAAPSRLSVLPEDGFADEPALLHGAIQGRKVGWVGLVPFDALWQRNRIVTSTALLRRDAWVDVGGFDERRALIGVEDYHCWLRLCHRGHRLLGVDAPMTIYRPTAQSLTRNTRRFATAELALREDLTPRFGREVELGDWRFRLAREYAREAFHTRDFACSRDLYRLARQHGVLSAGDRLRAAIATTAAWGRR